MPSTAKFFCKKTLQKFCRFKKTLYICIAIEGRGVDAIIAQLPSFFAKIAQLVEHNLAKVRVAGSSPVFRS